MIDFFSVEKYKTLKKDISSIKDVRNLIVGTRPPVSIKEIESLEKREKWKIPEALKTYYKITNGHNISWSLSRENDLVMGKSIVFSIQSAFSRTVTGYKGGKIETNLPFHCKSLDEDQKGQLDNYFLFEDIGFDRYVLINKIQSIQEPILYIYEPPFLITKLEISFEKYLENIFLKNALLNWQESFKIDNKDSDFLRDYDSKNNFSIPDHNPIKKIKNKYTFFIKETIGRLKSSNLISNLQLSEYPPLNINYIKKIHRILGFELPDEFLNFYLANNGFKLYWKFKPNTGYDSFGLIDMPPLETVFGGAHPLQTPEWDDYAIYPELWNENSMIDLPDSYRNIKKKRFFDRHLNTHQLLIEVENENIEFHYFIEGATMKINRSFDTIINVIQNSAGIEYYPELLLTEQSNFKQDIIEKIKLINNDFYI